MELLSTLISALGRLTIIGGQAVLILVMIMIIVCLFDGIIDLIKQLIKTFKED